MTADKNFHVNDDQMLRAVVDESDLSSALQEHLLSCPHCRGKKSDMEKALFTLGQMAERFSPSPDKRIVLPPKPLLAHKEAWHLRKTWSMAFACVTALVLGTWFFLKDMPGEQTAMVTQNTADIEQLMEEIDALSENALPQEYMAMMGDSDNEKTDGFLDFLIPSMENDTTSFNLNQTGGEPC